MKEDLKQKVISLRKQGKTYSEICRLLDKKISKGTLFYWCKGIPLPLGYEGKIIEYKLFALKKARIAAGIAIREKTENKIRLIRKANWHLKKETEKINTAKIALAMLYLGEGSKSIRHCVYFGNSNSLTVGLFLHLLRRCYKINESKLRCTVQCRADQDIKKLEAFWQEITKIPVCQFYKAQVDPRTIDKPSKKLDYKGVCRIDYLSADVARELLEIPKIIMGP